MKNKLKIILIAFIIGAISSCSAFEERLKYQAKESEFKPHDTTLICRPADAIGCIGWAGNKGVIRD
jgi:hypothetical protein|tara:strand:- start:302 stop:499 length:198 start_codon:yes stop_codon:yes gene_type:complete